MTVRNADVLRRIDESWQDLQSAVAEVPAQRMEESGVVEAWSIKDLLGHVTTWESEMTANVQRVVDGLEMKTYLDIDEFNAETSAAKSATSLEVLREEMTSGHVRTLEFVSALSEELLSREDVEWRIRIDTFAHYREHAEHIRSWLSGTGPSRLLKNS